MPEHIRAALQELRALGYGVIIWTPEELAGVDPDDVQDRSIEYGHEVIEILKQMLPA